MTDWIRCPKCGTVLINFLGFVCPSCGYRVPEQTIATLEGVYIENEPPKPNKDIVVIVRCKDCIYYIDGDCWHEWDNDGRIYYQSVINEPNPDDYCSKGKRKEE